MSLDSLLVHDVTILRAGSGTDRYRNTVKNWATATSTTVRGWIARTSTSEDRTNREAQLSGWVLYLPAGTDIDGGDRVTWDDRTFEVDGPPNDAWTPRGEHHVEAQLTIVDG